jgi:DNA-binding transcriptional MerR regulator
MRISELAATVGVPASTVRYYERIGLLGEPERASSGYRNYDDAAATRLLFITRARHMGLTCDTIATVLPAWDGTNCTAAQDRVGRLIQDKQAEIVQQIEEMQRFSAQLAGVADLIATTSPRAACCSDLTCCVPDSGAFLPLDVVAGS